MPRYEKGVSGNPNGRPVKKGSYTDSLRKVLEAQEMKVSLVVNDNRKVIDVKCEGKSFYDGIAVVHVMEALKGNLQAIKDISDRVDGKVTDKKEQTNTGNQLDGLKISFVDENDNTINPKFEMTKRAKD